jgi:hypothetical protein
MLKIDSNHHRQNGQQPERSLHFDFAVTDPWHVPWIMSELIEGFDKLAHLPPSVAILGSSRAKPGDAAYLAAVETARQLAQAVVPVSWRRPIRVHKRAVTPQLAAL